MEVVFEKKAEADEVLKRLRQLISQYDFVAVNDLKQMLKQQTQGLSRSEGWTSLDDATVSKSGVQWKLTLPDPDRAG